MNALLIDIFEIVVLIYSVVLHEVAHGLVARSMGDHTAEDMGRLTLNPLKHLELFGSFLLPLITKLTTGIMFGYAKPVPYDPGKLNDRRYGPIKVAMAGPATNILLAVIAGLFIRLGGGFLSSGAVQLIGYIVWINLILAAFNLIPIPPLDGHWLLITFLSARYHALKVALFRFQLLLLIVVIFFIFPLILPLLNGVFTLLTGVRLL